MEGIKKLLKGTAMEAGLDSLTVDKSHKQIGDSNDG